MIALLDEACEGLSDADAGRELAALNRLLSRLSPRQRALCDLLARLELVTGDGAAVVLAAPSVSDLLAGYGDTTIKGTEP